MTSCWQVEPTSERIVDNVLALPGVLEKIILAKGCVVQDQYLRSGSRAHRADDKWNCKNKPASEQRNRLFALGRCIRTAKLFKMLSGDALAKLNNYLDHVQADDIELSAAANMSS
jgi:hypothetical protein